jgi:hypothetical protein
MGTGQNGGRKFFELHPTNYASMAASYFCGHQQPAKTRSLFPNQFF